MSGNARAPLAAITQLNGTGPRLQQVAIEILPDEVLLDIFSFYVDEADKEDEWHTLVHVCQRWRNLVFASPRRLHLTLVYSPRRPVGEMLDLWPALPIVIQLGSHESLFELRKWGWRMERGHNIIVALKYHKRICRIAGSHLLVWNKEQLAAGMCRPFPMLTSLQLSEAAHTETHLPDSFLGGSAPRLRTLALIGISFPALPNLLLSAHDLIHLDLWDIPDSALIPSDQMVVCLSTLTRLRTLYLGFRSDLPGGTGRRLPPLRRFVLHGLTTLWFSGSSEYLEDFISRIDAPQLNDIDITFSDLFTLDTPQFVQFIDHTEMPSFNRATLRLYRNCVEVTLSSENLSVDQQSVRLRVSWEKSDWQMTSPLALCRLSLPLPLLCILEYLDFYDHANQWRHSADHTQWLEFLHLFPSVKSLSLSNGFTLPIMTALGELVGGRVLDVLPVLQNVCLHWRGPLGPLQEPVGLFIATRKLSGHPVAIHRVEPGDWIEDACGGREMKSALRFLSH